MVRFKVKLMRIVYDLYKPIDKQIGNHFDNLKLSINEKEYILFCYKAPQPKTDVLYQIESPDGEDDAWDISLRELDRKIQQIYEREYSLSKLIDIADVREHSLGFLEPNELAQLEKVSWQWKKAVQPNWEKQAVVNGITPEIVPAGMSLAQIFKIFYRGLLGEQVYRDHLGEVGPLPPIPRNFIEWSNRIDPITLPYGYVRGCYQYIKDNYQLVLIPQYITIEVDSNSPLTLRNGKLVEEWPSYSKTLKVPVTINNLLLLAKKYIKKRAQSNPDLWPDVLHQHGDEPVQESHWSYMKKDAIGHGLSYAQQKTLAESAGLEIVSLIDRVIYNLLMHIVLGIEADRNQVRTSTHFLPTSLQSTVSWCGTLNLCYDYGPSIDCYSSHYSAAVGIPTKNPPPQRPIRKKQNNDCSLI